MYSMVNPRQRFVGRTFSSVGRKETIYSHSLKTAIVNIWGELVCSVFVFSIIQSYNNWNPYRLVS